MRYIGTQEEVETNEKIRIEHNWWALTHSAMPTGNYIQPIEVTKNKYRQPQKVTRRLRAPQPSNSRGMLGSKEQETATFENSFVMTKGINNKRWVSRVPTHLFSGSKKVITRKLSAAAKMMTYLRIHSYRHLVNSFLLKGYWKWYTFVSEKGETNIEKIDR